MLHTCRLFVFGTSHTEPLEVRRKDKGRQRGARAHAHAAEARGRADDDDRGAAQAGRSQRGLGESRTRSGRLRHRAPGARLHGSPSASIFHANSLPPPCFLVLLADTQRRCCFDALLGRCVPNWHRKTLSLLKSQIVSTPTFNIMPEVVVRSEVVSGERYGVRPHRRGQNFGGCGMCGSWRWGWLVRTYLSTSA